MAFKSIFSLFSSDLAIDLGTANTLVYAKGRAVVGEVPIDDLWFAVPSFPTRSEVWLQLMEKLGL